MCLFNLYSWITGFGWLVLDGLPQFLRNIIFKTILEKFGSRGGQLLTIRPIFDILPRFLLGKEP